MAKLIKKKNQPTICFPSDLESEKQTGKLYGYFVENTNYYNVTAVGENRSEKRLSKKSDSLFLIFTLRLCSFAPFLFSVCTQSE